MVSFVTPNRHGYSIRFSPFAPHQLVIATSQYFGLTGGGTLFHLELGIDGKLHEKGQFQWSDGLFDVVWCEVAQSSGHLIITASGDCGLQLWNLIDNQPIKILKEHTKEVYSVDWIRNGKYQFISGSWDCTIKLWDLQHSTSLSTYTGHEQLVYNTKFSPHIPDCFASVSGDGTLKLWDSSCQYPRVSTKVHHAEVLSVDWSFFQPYILATGGSDGLIKIWDSRNFSRPCFELFAGEYAIRRVQFSPHEPNVLASVSYDCCSKIWNFNKGYEPVDVIKHHSEFVYGLDWNRFKSNEIADCGWDGLVYVFEVKTR